MRKLILAAALCALPLGAHAANYTVGHALCANATTDTNLVARDCTGIPLLTSGLGSVTQAYNATLAAIASGTYSGASSIATLGTVTTGVWHGSAIDLSTYANGTLASARLIGSYTGVTGTGALAAGSLASGFTPVSNSLLANSSLTIGSTPVSLGSTAATIAGLTLTAPAIGAATGTSLALGGCSLGANTFCASGQIASTKENISNAGNSRFINISLSSTGTGYIDMRATSTGGDWISGVESSAGGTLVSGAPAYAAIFGSTGATAACIVTNDNCRILISSAGAVQFRAYGAGALTTDASGNITASSDERLKNIAPFPFAPSIDALRRIKPVLYRWNKRSGLETETLYAGFRAQNVRAAFGKYGEQVTGRNPNGSMTLQDRALLAAAYVFIQHLDRRLVDQSARIGALENRLAAVSRTRRH